MAVCTTGDIDPHFEILSSLIGTADENVRTKGT